MMRNIIAKAAIAGGTGLFAIAGIGGTAIAGTAPANVSKPAAVAWHHPKPHQRFKCVVVIRRVPIRHHHNTVWKPERKVVCFRVHRR